MRTFTDEERKYMTELFFRNFEFQKEKEKENNKIIERRLNLKYLFSWDEIPGNDDKRIIEFLKNELKIEWVKTENISKIDDDKTIIISNEEKSLSLKLNDEKTKVKLKIDDDMVYEFTVKTENGKLNIYNLDKGIDLIGKNELNADLKELDLIYEKKRKRGLNKPMNGAERAMRMRIRKKVRVAVHDLLVANYCSLIPSTVLERKYMAEKKSISGLEEFMDIYLKLFQLNLKKFNEKSVKWFVYGGRPKFKGLKDVKKI